jgi:hypothetical protein
VGALEWRELRLPEGLDAVALAGAQDALVVGAQAPSQPRARLLVLRGENWREIPVAPESPYAFQARWLSLALHGDSIEAVGGARGGAHANYRWTAWTGTWAGPSPGLKELPQPFGVFGGWGAGDLTGVGFAGDRPFIAGAWQSERTGNDVSVWTRTGARWNRGDSTDTALGSTPTTLNGARSITTTGEGLALAGSVTDLGAGSVTVVPAVWRMSVARAEWAVTRLPASGNLAEAHGAACQGQDCLVAGVDDGRLAVWDLAGDSASAKPIPQVAVPDEAAVPPPVRTSAIQAVAAPGRLVLRSTSGWTQRTAPPGEPTALAAVRDTLYLVTTDASGHGRLWAATPETS